MAGYQVNNLNFFVNSNAGQPLEAKLTYLTWGWNDPMYFNVTSSNNFTLDAMTSATIGAFRFANVLAPTGQIVTLPSAVDMINALRTTLKTINGSQIISTKTFRDQYNQVYPGFSFRLIFYNYGLDGSLTITQHPSSSPGTGFLLNNGSYTLASSQYGILHCVVTDVDTPTIVGTLCKT